MQSDKVVRVTLDSTGLPIPSENPVHAKKDNQKIRWCADFDFQIEVDGYDDLTSGSNSGNSDCQFSVTTGAFGEIKEYKYSIIANGQTNDPEIVIDP
jgi:hypothetical protein